MYRIPIACVTACILILGCGGPSANELYDLEKRVSATEKTQGDASGSFDTVAAKADSLAAKLTSSEQMLNQRLENVENALSDIKKELAKEGPTNQTQSPSAPSPKLITIENRLKDIESKLASNDNRQSSNRSLVASRDETPATDVAMDDAAERMEKPTSKSKKKSGSNSFEMTLLSWNVESEGNDPKVIAKQLSEMSGYDVYGLCEVLPESIELYTEATGGDYRTIASRSGFNDRLQIIYNSKTFKLLRRLELKEINFEYRYRSPLVAHLQHKATGQQIMVLNNHLARGRAEVRTKQAEQLVEWARNQNVPIVAIGDYNFDYVFSTRKGNDGFVAMLRDNIWQWVEPIELIDTNWFDNPRNPDGRDDYEGSMLDFAFVAGAATEWKKECRVIVRPGDFPDDESTSDHRPFELKLSTK